jgi:predicted amidophosphoribosyltransferase
MGNRINQGLCINCGGPVIQPNDWHCCSQCIEEIKGRALKRIKNKGNVKPVWLPGIKKK